MLKQKYICLLMAFFLMFSNIGLAVNVHYCKDVVANTSFDFLSKAKLYLLEKSDSDICCGQKKSTQEEPCCKDEVIKQKTDDKQITSNTVQFQVNTFLVPEVQQIVIPEIFELQIPKNTFVQFYCESNAPPFYKLYRKLIYYA